MIKQTVKQIEAVFRTVIVLLDNGMIEVIGEGNTPQSLREYYAYRDDFTELRTDFNGVLWAISRTQPPIFADSPQSTPRIPYPNGVLNKRIGLISNAHFEHNNNTQRRLRKDMCGIVLERCSNGNTWETIRTYPELPNKQTPCKLFLIKTAHIPCVFTTKGYVYSFNDITNEWYRVSYDFPPFKDFTISKGVFFACVTMDGYLWTPPVQGNRLSKLIPDYLTHS